MTPKDVKKRLEAEGWFVARTGPGDHVQMKHPEKTGRVTIDMGVREIPIGTLRSVFRQAGWNW
ncbi:type II toxin-antitoxin system HicA family toxin [Siculibacillus lacustris]|uniref:Type II toxin-antitoxin system HicA family toxin n=2 Tax=Siculibacillus lacustris TaxID=1549641 RepID=A0A4Q9VG36_9HYPH|nr:type II toxin-antitoxin system HicA family toxin [Siculibacillus lacustris]